MIQAKGVGYVPLISFEDVHSIDMGMPFNAAHSNTNPSKNTLRFKPTCIGAASKRLFVIRNLSRISVSYKWAIPKQYSSFVSITPSNGVLEPNSHETLCCVFSPKIEKNWVLKIPCYYKHEIDGCIEEKVTQQRVALTVIGKGTTGRITTDVNGKLDFGPCLVNTVVEKGFTIYNPCECDVYYKLEILSADKSKPVVFEEGDVIELIDKISVDNNKIDSTKVYKPENLIRSTRLTESEIEIVAHEAMLPARSCKSLQIKLQLKNASEKQFQIFYVLESKNILCLFTNNLPDNLHNLGPKNSSFEDVSNSKDNTRLIIETKVN